MRALPRLRLTVAAGTAILAVAAVAGTALWGEPWAEAVAGPHTRVDGPTSREVAVTPPPAQLVCPSPARLPRGTDVGDDQFAASPVDTVSRDVRVVWGEPGRTAQAGPLGRAPATLTQGAGVGWAAGDPAGRPTTLAARPAAGQPLRAAAAVASVTTAGDLRGLAAGSCAVPSISQWLVGGSTEVGASALLEVQNPSERAATVTIEVYGPAGPVALGSRGVFVLGPGEARTTRLDAVAPDERRLAVHVTSTGARVGATLQTQAIEGLVPQGTELVAPGASPAAAVVVPALRSRGEAIDDPRAVRLRLLNPGTAAATAAISVYGPQGLVRVRGGEAVRLEPGAVTDFPLGGLPAGEYTAVVDADRPVVAAGEHQVSGAEPAGAVVHERPWDDTWVAGQAVAGPGRQSQVAVPAGVRGRVLMTAVPAVRAELGGAAATAVVRVYEPDGTVRAERKVALSPGRVVSLDVARLVPGATGAAVTLDAGPGSSVAWAVRLEADDGSKTPGTLVSTLTPVRAIAAPGVVRVGEVPATG